MKVLLPLIFWSFVCWSPITEGRLDDPDPPEKQWWTTSTKTSTTSNTRSTTSTTSTKTRTPTTTPTTTTTTTTSPTTTTPTTTSTTTPTTPSTTTPTTTPSTTPSTTTRPSTTSTTTTPTTSTTSITRATTTTTSRRPRRTTTVRTTTTSDPGQDTTETDDPDYDTTPPDEPDGTTPPNEPVCHDADCPLYNGKVKYVATRGNSTGVWIINGNNVLLKMDPEHKVWEKQMDDVSAVAAGFDGSVWVIHSKGRLLSRKEPGTMRSDMRWDNLGPVQFSLIQISAKNGEELYGTNGQYMYFKHDTRPWTAFYGTGKCISVRDDGMLYTVGTSDHAVYYMKNSGWQKIEKTVNAETTDSCGSNCHLYIDRQSQVFVWNKGWKKQPFRADQAAITRDGIYFVHLGRLYFTQPNQPDTGINIPIKRMREFLEESQEEAVFD